MPGYELVTLGGGQPNQTKTCVAVASSANAHKTMIAVSVTGVAGAGLIAAIITGLLWLLRVHIAAFTLQRAKKRGPPGEHPGPSQGICTARLHPQSDTASPWLGLASQGHKPKVDSARKDGGCAFCQGHWQLRGSAVQRRAGWCAW